MFKDITDIIKTLLTAEYKTFGSVFIILLGSLNPAV